MTIVHVPDRPHRCGPNDYGHWLDHWNDQPGTVRECPDCGKTWVAYRPHPAGGYMGVLWRPEGWLARRRRLKSRRRETTTPDRKA